MAPRQSTRERFITSNLLTGTLNGESAATRPRRSAVFPTLEPLLQRRERTARLPCPVLAVELHPLCNELLKSNHHQVAARNRAKRIATVEQDSVV
jgi:hypothetical protein